MRYIHHFLQDIDGIGVYPMISLLMFFLFFVGLTLYVVRMRKQHVRYMAAIPLDGETESSPEPSER
jgi:cytochrome c oxidase cbb3-type subunit IV